MNSYLLPLSCNSKIERVPLNTVCDNLLRSYSNVLTKQTRGTTLLVVVCRIQRLEESGALRGNWGFLLLRTGYLMEHFFLQFQSPKIRRLICLRYMRLADPLLFFTPNL